MAPGELLRFQIEAASGLTPPPGLQEDRAHRGFAAGLCARGLALGAPERSCFPLPVRNVRPVDGASLGYRVEAPLPAWVAPGRYDLAVRFPGGRAELTGGVLVGAEPAADAAWRLEGPYVHAAAPADRPARLRVHVGQAGLDAGGARFEAYPLPDPVRGFRDGFVAVLALSPGAQVRLRARSDRAAPRLAIVAPVAEAGRPVTLRADADPGRVYWWLDADRGALGPAVTTHYVLRGAAPVEALLVSADGRSRHVRGSVPVVARLAFGCALGPARERAGPPAWLLMAALCCAVRWAARGGAAMPLRRTGRHACGVRSDGAGATRPGSGNWARPGGRE